MKYLDEFRNLKIVQQVSRNIIKSASRKWNIMEICGGQTHSILKYGLDQLVEEKINLIHGPGCPVCVTPAEVIDQAVELALRKDTVLCCFGDMIRVPGNKISLAGAKARGGNVKFFYSPLESLDFAKKNPDKETIFFISGFETTVPLSALLVLKARQEKISNFSVLACHFLVPPAITALLQTPDVQINGFLAAGHVCTITGFQAYLPIAERFKLPIVIAGFEPIDLILAMETCVDLLEKNQNEVKNLYARSVKPEGNISAWETVNKVFYVSDQDWRGLGIIPSSGLKIRQEFADFDAEKKFTFSPSPKNEATNCISGMILSGRLKPLNCPNFGTKCTPENPIGAPMVSNEGACLAYFKYRATHNPLK
ncbi:MAG: hydrogenase formation protein HypD [Candidatus Riflebacteria bacterium]|nr:hydrogenase formation protein HypD [Candidatus Riflebacteria bacterium]